MWVWPNVTNEQPLFRSHVIINSAHQIPKQTGVESRAVHVITDFEVKLVVIENIYHKFN